MIGRSKSKVFQDYKVVGRPQMYIINREGSIVYEGNEISAAMVNEVLKTDRLKPQDYKKSPELILNGGFRPGEDPLYNGMRIMAGADPRSRPKLFKHFIIRPSLDTSFCEYGVKGPHDGHVGFTYYSGSLEGIFETLLQLSSSVWIENQANLTDKYDIVYWKKKASQKEAFQEIQERILSSLSIDIQERESKEEINLMYLSTPYNKQEAVRKPDDLPLGAEAAYTSINDFIHQLEVKTGSFFQADASIANTLIAHEGMAFEQLWSASAEEIRSFLAEKGIKIKTQTKYIKTYQIIQK